jgi:hypothetical protein
MDSFHAKIMNSDERNGRPKGCYFDVYGADEEMLRTLTCENCPLPAMVCDFRNNPIMNKLASSIKVVEVTSDE